MAPEEQHNPDPPQPVHGDEASASSQKAVEPAELDAWVDRYGDVLFRYAVVRVHDRHAAEDMVQETFVAAMESRDSFRGDSAERTWLIGILRHKMMDHLRRQRREHPVQADNSGADEDQDPLFDRLFDQRGNWKKHPGRWRVDPAALAEDSEFWQVFQRCFDGLSERVGQAFALRVMDQQPSEQVCKVLSITSTNLWVMLHRARARLRECLESHWFASEGNPGRKAKREQDT